MNSNIEVFWLNYLRVNCFCFGNIFIVFAYFNIRMYYLHGNLPRLFWYILSKDSIMTDSSCLNIRVFSKY